MAIAALVEKTEQTPAELLATVPKLCEQGEQERAIELCLGILDDDENNLMALYYGGVAAHQAGDNNSAISLLCRAVEVQPNEPAIRDILGAAYGQRGDWVGALAHGRQAFAQQATSNRHSNLIWGLAHRPNTPMAMISDEMRAYGARWHGENCAHANERTTARRIRVGYVSADLFHHSANTIVGPVLFKHDHDRFEITVYSGVRKPDNVTAGYKVAADHWHDVAEWDDDTLVKQIQDDQIDILVDLSGHSGGNRLPVFGRKPAPIQVTAWGYVIGTGLREMDYIIGDAIAMPSDWCAQYLTEKPWHLPCTVAFNAPWDAPDIEPAPVENNGHLTFGYYGRASKITTQTTDQWAEILRVVPDAKLILKDPTFIDPPCRERVVNELMALGINASRIDVRIQPTQRLAHIASYRDIDIALESCPAGGGATVLEGAWMGVPTLMVCGDRITSRIGTSIMTTIGEGHWSRLTTADAAGWAKTVSENQSLLMMTRKRIRQGMQDSIICQSTAYSKAVEAAYEAMWLRYCEGV